MAKRADWVLQISPVLSALIFQPDLSILARPSAHMFVFLPASWELTPGLLCLIGVGLTPDFSACQLTQAIT